MAVPLVALGTQNGSIDIVDVSANAVAASFSVHDGIVRGLRWLGNTRLVSFSHSLVLKTLKPIKISLVLLISCFHLCYSSCIAFFRALN